MSNLFKFNLVDVGRALITAMLTGVLTFIYEALKSGMAIDWHQVLMIAMIAGLGYLIKNFFSTEDGKFMGRI